MAYICWKKAKECNTCSHFRLDDDRHEMCCWAKDDEVKLIALLKSIPRYQDFFYFENSIRFKDFFKDDNFDVVQIHDTTLIGENDIVGFAGVCCWKNNSFIPLDGDSYDENMTIYGFKKFSTGEKKILRCISK